MQHKWSVIAGASAHDSSPQARKKNKKYTRIQEYKNTRIQEYKNTRM
jgi:hypothetical protein